MLESYFEVGKPVSDEKFIGREKELKQLDFFVKQNQSIVLVAPRRYGKTSIVKKFFSTLSKEYFKIEIDFMRYISKKDLADAIIEKCYENIEYKKAIEDMKSGLLSFSKKLSSLIKINIGVLELDGFEKFLNKENIDEDSYLIYAFEFAEKFSKAHNKQLIFFIDEFAEISKYDKNNDLLKQLRSVIQHQENITYIFAGSQPTLMNKIFLNKDEPFFKFATVMKIGKLDKDSFILYCEKLFKIKSIKCDKNYIEDIYQFCGGVAYNLSLSMMMLLMQNEKEIKNDNIEETKNQVLNVSGFGYENEIELLKRRKHHFEVIVQIVKDLNPYLLKNIKKQNINNILKNLEIDGIIEKSDDKYILNDIVFGYYLKNRLLN
ncbi:MAG: hypothetical protein U9R39_00630 [Campylobacterota bacterium]|nr:hypothetical protein [Campylobacterota bacterium]